jgi:hypothetical protein
VKNSFLFGTRIWTPNGVPILRSYLKEASSSTVTREAWSEVIVQDPEISGTTRALNMGRISTRGALRIVIQEQDP